MGKRIKTGKNASDSHSIGDAPTLNILEALPRTDECAQALRDQVEANWQLYQRNLMLEHQVKQLEAENMELRSGIHPTPQPSRVVVPTVRMPRFKLPGLGEILSGRLSPMFIPICVIIGLGIGLVIKVFFG